PEPYHPVYFMINGRSMPDDMDTNYAAQYPHQPYNGNPHMHPGELTLLRIIGQGRWQHPFHEHGNHVRILGRDGNLILSATDPNTLADPNLFTNGAWYGGSPYLGPNATVRAAGPTGSTPPSGTIANSPTGEAGFAFMWHSHNEREITTNNIFPGGMLMMMLVDSREFVIDESN